MEYMKTAGEEGNAGVHRRLAELKEQLKDSRAEQKADAAAYASSLEAQQVTVHSAMTVMKLLHYLHPMLTSSSAIHPEMSRLVRKDLRVFCRTQFLHRCCRAAKFQPWLLEDPEAVVWGAGPPQRPAGGK